MRAHHRDGIAYQHRRLDILLEEIALALDEGDRRRCETAAFRLQGAVQAHFDVEEQVVFPTVMTQRSDVAQQIQSLEAAHQRLRLQLEGLCMSVFAADESAVLDVLAEFRDALMRHEWEEEALLRDTQELDLHTPQIWPPTTRGPLR